MESASPRPRRPASWKRYANRLIARELSRLTRYYDQVIQWLPRPDDSGLLLESLDCPARRRVDDPEDFPDLSGETERRTAVLINGAFNHEPDVQARLEWLKARLCHTSRVLVVLYNPYFRWLYRLANRLGLRRGDLPDTFLTRAALDHLARLSGYAVVWHKPRLYCPFRLLGLGNLVNRLLPLVPLVRWLGLVDLAALRPVMARPALGLSCIIPARNERGNIEEALRRFPSLGCPVEILFVEGHSTDGTWEEIERVARLWGSRFRIRALRQPGSGKADAVRYGFEHAAEPLLVILDADLTVPPETLGRFYAAWRDGLGDFVNGSRLVYPIEGGAMRFLNRLGNVFFAKLLSWLLEARFGDSLCGTKLLARHDYRRIAAWRKDFGELDPFGDFDLLFGASVLALDSVDVPVRYRARTYGRTNIRRFRHGFMLARMAVAGLIRIKCGAGA